MNTKFTIMKTLILILSMTLIATSAYNQSSRRSDSRETSRSRTAAEKNDQYSNQKSTSKGSADRTTNNSRTRTSSSSSRRENTASTTSTQNTATNGVNRNHTEREKNNGPRRTETHKKSSSSSNKVYVAHKKRHYYNPPRRVYRHRVEPRPRSYRATHHPYRAPVHVDIVWSNRMYVEYREIYPHVRFDYRYGYRIPTISAYNAYYHAGDLRNVYGRVSEVYYSHRSDEYYLYFGAYYPYHDFEVVVPGYIARRFSRYPESYFTNNYLMITGYISRYNKIPLIEVYRESQLRPY